MGQKVTTRVADKSRQDMAKYRLWMLTMRLLHKIEPIHHEVLNLNPVKIAI